jgi:hypothetical protein
MSPTKKSTADDVPAHFDQDTPVQRAANAATARVVRGRADEAAPVAKKSSAKASREASRKSAKKASVKRARSSTRAAKRSEQASSETAKD